MSLTATKHYSVGEMGRNDSKTKEFLSLVSFSFSCKHVNRIRYVDFYLMGIVPSVYLGSTKPSAQLYSSIKSIASYDDYRKAFMAYETVSGFTGSCMLYVSARFVDGRLLKMIPVDLTEELVHLKDEAKELNVTLRFENEEEEMHLKMKITPDTKKIHKPGGVLG